MSCSRNLSVSAPAKFKEEIPSTFNLIPCFYVREESCKKWTPAQIDHVGDSATGSLWITLDSVTLLKKKKIKQQRLAPWHNPETRKIKQKSRQPERIWRSTKLKESCLIWHITLNDYKKAIRKARAAYYSSLIEEKKNNARFIFSTVARLTESHSSIELSIPIALSSNDLMCFFNDTIITL